jgi:hypothetical protein
MNELADIIALFAIQIVSAISCAFVGNALSLSMRSTRDILGFVPPYIEQRYGAHSKLYHLATCAKCLSGQVAIAFCIVPPYYGLKFYIPVIAGAIVFGNILESKTR